ncbi:MAG: ABC transporter permease [Lachnospiraceae bacterium]|nr:ABC transporter permease [Lachnospiraceae bacterium]
MGKYILKRIAGVIVTLLILSVAIFSITHIMSGDPALAMLGSDASAEQVEALRAEMGLDQPLTAQYISWIKDTISGDLGDSYFRHQTVIQALSERIGPSTELAIISELIAILIGIPLGITAAKRKGGAVDLAASSAAILGMSMPAFLLGLLFILLFSVNMGVLPVSGYVTVAKGGLSNHLSYMVIPCVTMGLVQSALIMRITRSSFAEVMGKDYIKTAKAKGLKERVILYKHVFRNAGATIVTILGQSFGSLIAGVAVLETMFNIPGMGQLIVDSVLKRDYPVIQGAVLFVSILYVLINLVVDISYGFIDPRIRVTRS